jgi:hypothetical protein
MNERTVVIAALIIGGAIVTASFLGPRYTLSAANNNIVWRMDTWSGEIDICAAAYPATGPLVRCGVTVVAPVEPPQPQPQSQSPSPSQSPAQQGGVAPLPPGTAL